MASLYGVITLAQLELFSSEDYSVIDPVYLDDAHVDAKITAAEEFVFGYIGVELTTFSAGIVYSVKVIATRMIYKWMRDQGMMLSKEKLLDAAKPLVTPDVEKMLSKYTGRANPIKIHRLFNNDPTVYY